MLDPFSRSAIVGLSALCVAGTFALAPLRARSSIPQTVRRPAPPALNAAADTMPAVSILRDPFAEPIARVAEPPEDATAGAAGTLPSNLANDIIPALPGARAENVAAEIHVTAVVTGAHPYALVESDGVHEIKGIGDRVGSSVISTIAIDGVRLRSGAYLTVDRGVAP